MEFELTMNKWTKRYLDIAKDVASWSKDPSTQVGSVCVGSHGQILSQGYNGFPRGIRDFPRRLEVREEKYRYVVHAEVNSIYNACLNGVSLEGATIYVYGLPICTECAKGVIQVGIERVIMQHPREDVERWADSCNAARDILKEAGVAWIRYDTDYKMID